MRNSGVGRQQLFSAFAPNLPHTHTLRRKICLRSGLCKPLCITHPGIAIGTGATGATVTGAVSVTVTATGAGTAKISRIGTGTGQAAETDGEVSIKGGLPTGCTWERELTNLSIINVGASITKLNEHPPRNHAPCLPTYSSHCHLLPDPLHISS